MIGFLTKNWTAKLISLILAVGLWYYAVGEEGIEVRRTVPVEIKLENEKMSIVGKPVRFVVVTLQAPRALLGNLASGGDLRAEHVIRKVDAAGDYSFRLEPREIQLPSEKVRVVRIDPEVILVKIDEIILKKLQVQQDFLGEPAIGYRLNKERIQLDPGSVLVEGPKAQLEKAEKILTQPIDLVGRTRSFRKTVRLVEEPGLKILSEPLIDAYLPIEEMPAEKIVEGVPLKWVGTAGVLSPTEIKPAELPVSLRGSEKSLENLQAKDIFLYVEVSNLLEGVHEVTPQAVLPEGIVFKENLPKVKVTIRRKGA